MFKYPFRLPFNHPFRGAFARPGFGASIPTSDEFLVRLMGTSTDTQKIDSWVHPDAENFDMSQSHCLTMGGSETGVTTVNHGTIVSSEGTSTPFYDGTTLTFTAGTFYHLVFSDGSIYRIAEGLRDTSFDQFGNAIVWSATNWTGRQDSYHGNAVDGFGYRENLIKFSEDLTQTTAWGAIDVTVLDATSQEFTAQYGRIIQYCTTLDAEEYTIKFKCRRITGNANLNLRHNGSATGSSQSFNITDTLDDYELTFLGKAGGGLVEVGIQDINASGFGQIEVVNWHVTLNDGAYIKTEAIIFKGTEKLPFFNDNKGNTFNEAETSFAPESFTVGYMSLTDEITLPFEVPDDGAIQNNGTCTLVLDTVNNKITCTVAGVVRDIEITSTPVIAGTYPSDTLFPSDTLYPSGD